MPLYPPYNGSPKDLMMSIKMMADSPFFLACWVAVVIGFGYLVKRFFFNRL